MPPIHQSTISSPTPVYVGPFACSFLSERRRKNMCGVDWVGGRGLLGGSQLFHVTTSLTIANNKWCRKMHERTNNTWKLTCQHLHALVYGLTPHGSDANTIASMFDTNFRCEKHFLSTRHPFIYVASHYFLGAYENPNSRYSISARIHSVSKGGMLTVFLLRKESLSWNSLIKSALSLRTSILMTFARKARLALDFLSHFHTICQSATSLSLFFLIHSTCIAQLTDHQSIWDLCQMQCAAKRLLLRQSNQKL